MKKQRLRFIFVILFLNVMMTFNLIAQFQTSETEDVYGKTRIAECTGEVSGVKDKPNGEAKLVVTNDYNNEFIIDVVVSANDKSIFCFEYALELRCQGDNKIYKKQIEGRMHNGLNHFFIIYQDSQIEVDKWTELLKESSKVFLRFSKSRGVDSCTDDYFITFDLIGSSEAITWVEDL